MEVFAAAKRQYRLQLRPDEVMPEANWGNRTPPAQEEIAAALAQLAAWVNPESQPDMMRVAATALELAALIEEPTELFLSHLENFRSSALHRPVVF